MPLTEVLRGNMVRVEGVEVQGAQARRLEELGILPGERIDVLRNEGPCPLVLGLGAAKLMLGRDLGSRIQVAKVDRP